MNEKPYRGVFHWDPELQKIVDGPADARKPEQKRIFRRGCSDGGIAFQFPKDYLRETGKYAYVNEGPFKGRLRFRNKQEAREVAAYHEHASGLRTRYDPD